MFYKIEENGNWLVGNKVIIPNDIVLSEDNKEEFDGWKWYDTPPSDYIDWLSTKKIMYGTDEAGNN